MDELKSAAFECLLLNPGSEFGDWVNLLIEQYPSEVVDAFGTNPETVHAELADLWETPYLDIATKIEQTYSQWAMAFVNEYSVGIYYNLVDALKKPPKTYEILTRSS